MMYNVKSIKIPHFCELLAEETGIHIGDGSMWINRRERGVTYGYTVNLHLLEDESYSKYILSMMKRLYGIIPVVKTYDGRNERCILLLSKNLIEFKNKIGLPVGPKLDIKMPNWILKNNKFTFACIRGIVDTDGSLTFKRKYRTFHYYPVIKIDSISSILIKQIVSLLSNFGIDSSYYHYKSKNAFYRDNWTVYISGVHNLGKYLKLFGFSNRKHITKLNIWKKYGFCPPNTNINERELILSEKLDPHDFY